MSAIRDHLHNVISNHCAEIEKLFLPGAKVTVLVRNPSVSGDAGVLVTNDEDEEIRRALDLRLQKKPAHSKP